MIATVVKKYATVPAIAGGRVTLHRGTELELERRHGGYLARVVSGEQSATDLILTERQASAWLVFRTAEALGLEPPEGR